MGPDAMTTDDSTQIEVDDEVRRMKKGDAALAAALASGMTVADAARAAGIGRTTAYRRLKEPSFRRMVEGMKGEMVETTVVAIAASTRKAVDRLTELLDHQSPSVQLQAARALLSQGVKVLKVADAVGGADVQRDEEAGGETVVDLTWTDVKPPPEE